MLRPTQVGLRDDKSQVLGSVLGPRPPLQHETVLTTGTRHSPTTRAPAHSGLPSDPVLATNNNDFGPRVRIAWSATPRVVIRSGYRIYFQDYPVGFGSYFVPETPCQATSRFCSGRLRTYPIPLIRSSRRPTPPPPNVNGFPWHKPDIYSNQWNLSVADQFAQNMSSRSPTLATTA